MRSFIIACQFLTIVPLPIPVRCEENDLGRSMAVFPLVGVAIGGLLVAADYLLSGVLPRSVVDLVLVALSSGVTGGLHLDGLADVCDGLAARGSRERFLEVMKDPRVGAVGAAGLVLAILLKYQALLALPSEHKWQALVFFPMAARFAQVLCTVGAQRARRDGLGSLFIGGAGTLQLVIASVLACGAAFLLFGLEGIGCVVALALFTWLLKRWAHRRLGGITGDVIGCVSELSEIVALLVLLALSGR